MVNLIFIRFMLLRWGMCWVLLKYRGVHLQQCLFRRAVCIARARRPSRYDPPQIGYPDVI